jgi:hypothetical protein
VPQGDHELVALALHAVAPDPQAWVHDAAPGRDLEVPLVPWAAEQARRLAAYGGLLSELDAAHDPSGRAQRRAAVRATVRDGVVLPGDLVEADLVAAELEHPDLAGAWSVGERHAHQRPGHARTAIGSEKKRAAFS